MASLIKNSYPFTLALIFLSQLLTSSLVFTRSLEDQEASAPQAALPPLPPVSPEVREYLEECTSKLSANCAFYYGGIIIGAPYPGPCCDELLDAGFACYNALVTTLLPSHPEADIKEVLIKRNKVWDDCLEYQENAHLAN